MFHWVTGINPTRRIDPSAGEYESYDEGPFFDLVAALWPLAFGNDDGLSYGMRKWVESIPALERRYGEKWVKEGE